MTASPVTMKTGNTMSSLIITHISKSVWILIEDTFYMCTVTYFVTQLDYEIGMINVSV